MTDDLAKNVDYVFQIVAEHASHADRRWEDISVLAATKSRSVELIQTYIDLLSARGHNVHIGENYVQEFEDKLPQLQGEFACSLIGPLQRNKAKRALAVFDAIESVDRMSLLEQLATLTMTRERPLPVFLQVNISQDDSKSGFHPSDLDLPLEFVLQQKGITLKGLMAITAYYERAEDARPDFAAMRKILTTVEERYGLKNLELSMGMSADYHIAIEEGATRVRVGEGIFGPRN